MSGALVALVGADGAGKSTLARRLVVRWPVPSAYLYMGDNPASAEKVLPTTRLLWAVRRRWGAPTTHGPPQRAPEAVRLPGRTARAARLATSLVVLAVQIAEEAHQLARARRRSRRGWLVIVDRWFPFDYHAHTGRAGDHGLAPRLHGAWLRRWFPRPDLTVCLDADPKVLLARKGEGTVTTLARRRQEYLDLAPAAAFHVVDAGQPLDQVEAEVAELVAAALGRTDR